MQSLSWYYRRLRTMSIKEVIWRGRSLARDTIDVVRLKLDLFPSLNSPAHVKSHGLHPRGYSVVTATFAEENVDSAGSQEKSCWVSLIRHANLVLEHKFTFFDLNAKYLGDPIDWHKDHSSGKRAKLRPSPLINYRDFQSVGDCKLVWEPNRHHQLVVLARAWRVSGQERYAVEIARQLGSWLDQNPFGYGMNWRSPLELGIRLINWVWSLDLIRESEVISDELWAQIYPSAYLHCWDISRKYSRGSSANNHLIGEAAGVFIAASYFKDFPNSEGLILESRGILEREIFAQSYEDGCNREQALGYQLFVMQFFTLAALVAEWTGESMSLEYLDRLHGQYSFIANLSDGGPTLPMFGDKDDGYVLELGDSADSVDAALAIGACLFDDPELAERVRQWPESPGWLFPSDIVERARGNAGKMKGKALSSHAFEQSGYYLLQCGRRDFSDSVSLLFDCGDLGFGSLAAHGHADALSFSLRLGGRPIFIDPGTFDYFTYPEWRNYFRSTRAHNTVEIDNVSQSRITGSFMWGNHARSRCLSFDLNSKSPTVTGSHNGYESLQDPVRITRTIRFDSELRRITITDNLIFNGSHSTATYFHLDSAVHIKKVSTNSFRLTSGDAGIILTLDSSLGASVIEGSDAGPLGWVSPRYHSRIRSIVVAGKKVVSSTTSLVHIIDIM